jgi:Sensors of blue-light using FAD
MSMPQQPEFEMSRPIRLVYASRSTSPPGSQGQGQGLDLGIARILAKSRKNNAQKQIVGGLLFGDGCFLQCLEGDDEAVDALYKKIEADRRHRDVRMLARAPIAQRSFAAWSMKYVPAEKALGELLRAWGATRFDPYGLSPQQIDAAVLYLQQETDAAITLPADLDDVTPPAPLPQEPVAIIRKLNPSAGPRRPPSAAAPAKAAARRRSVPRVAWLVAIGALGAVLYWVAR